MDAGNLNRQNYTQLDLTKSKAHTRAARLKTIDHDVHIEVIDSYLDETSIKASISKADVVIHAIDFDSPAFPVAGRLCRQYRKLELFPMNLGFESSVCVFLPDSPTWESLFPGQDHVALKHSILMPIAVDMRPSLSLRGLRALANGREEELRSAARRFLCDFVDSYDGYQSSEDSGKNDPGFAEVLSLDPFDS